MMARDPLLTVQGLSYTYPGAAVPALQKASLELHAGECLCLTGPSGCGKTTLLLAIKGLLKGGSMDGEINFAGENFTDDRADSDTRRSVGLVFQNVESQLLCTTVAEEVAFGPENLGVPSEEITGRVRRSLRAVNLTAFAPRNLERLSAGQKQRLAIASVLSMESRLLLLDEPTSQLDSQGKAELLDVLRGLKQQGYALLIAAHDLKPLREITERFLSLTPGRVVQLTDDFADLPLRRAGGEKESPAGPEDGEWALVCQDLCLSYPETGVILTEINLQVPRGKRVHLSGRNGAGKSSLLRCLVGIDNPDRGKVTIAGVEHPQADGLLGKVGLLVQNPARQLFENTVFDEVAFSLRRLTFPLPELNRTVAATLTLCEIDHLAQRAPLTLSFGEQHRVALAAVLAPRPEVLLLDEPFAGLDREQQLRLLHILAGLPAHSGTTVVIASHDSLPEPGWADCEIALEGGRIASAAH